jgi:hypothetical protein
MKAIYNDNYEFRSGQYLAPWVNLRTHKFVPAYARFFGFSQIRRE